MWLQASRCKDFAMEQSLFEITATLLVRNWPFLGLTEHIASPSKLRDKIEGPKTDISVEGAAFGSQAIAGHWPSCTARLSVLLSMACSAYHRRFLAPDPSSRRYAESAMLMQDAKTRRRSS